MQKVSNSIAEINHDNNEQSDELPAPPVSTLYTMEVIATLLQKSYETVKRPNIAISYLLH